MTYKMNRSSVPWSLVAIVFVGVVRVTLLPIERLTPARRRGVVRANRGQRGVAASCPSQFGHSPALGRRSLLLLPG
jgi:hypothetical protein